MALPVLFGWLWKREESEHISNILKQITSWRSWWERELNTSCNGKFGTKWPRFKKIMVNINGREGYNALALNGLWHFWKATSGGPQFSEGIGCQGKQTIWNILEPADAYWQLSSKLMQVKNGRLAFHREVQLEPLEVSCPTQEYPISDEIHATYFKLKHFWTVSQTTVSLSVLSEAQEAGSFGQLTLGSKLRCGDTAITAL